MAAEGAVSFVLQKIDYILTQEVSLLSGVDGEAEGLIRELDTIRALLKRVDAKGGSNEQIKVWIKQVRDLAYDIEDILDMYSFHRSKTSGQFRKLFRLPETRSIATLIQEINQKLRSIKETRERYTSTNEASATSGTYTQTNYTYFYPRVASLFMDETDILGIEKPRNELIAWATDDQSCLNPKPKVMFVVGMGGLGKSLVVKKVYEGIKERFDCCAWITISKRATKVELLDAMLRQFFEPTPQELNHANLIQLMDKFRGYLQNKKYLIVLDDLWSKENWESIRIALPNQNRGRVIITTRRGDMASFCSDSSATIYNLQPLPLEKAKLLFYKKIFPLSGKCPSGLVKWSEKFLKQCEGLPLGIVAIGQILSNTEKTTDAWRRLHDTLGSELENKSNLSSIWSVLSASYNDLPYYLKYCLLYFSVFPEDYSIRRRKLIRLWIAERLVQPVKGKTLEEVGEDYVKELIQRNLVQVIELDFDGRAKLCRVHHLLHKILLCRAQDENFCRVCTEPEINLNDKIRRLSIHKTTSFSSMSQKSFPRARSLSIFFGPERLPLSHSTIQTILSNFCILKVLDLEGAPLNEFPTAITDLLLLQYLSLKNTNIKSLPCSIGKLQNLETLDLKQTLITKLPNNIFKLSKLQHLLVYHNNIRKYVTFYCVQGFQATKEIGKLVALLKLSSIQVNKCEGLVSALGNLTQLRKLGILGLKKQDGENLCRSIERMNNLQSLNVTSIWEDEFLDLTSLKPDRVQLLQRLYLNGCLQKLPDWIPKLHDLVRVRLTWSKLQSNPIDAFQDLPNLMELQLSDAYTGNQLVFGPNKFPSLKKLALEYLKALEHVIVEEGSLTCLEKLILRECQKLNQVPQRIDKLVNIKQFYLYDMPEELVNGLQKNGGQFHGLVHRIPHIRTYSRGEWRLLET